MSIFKKTSFIFLVLILLFGKIAWGQTLKQTIYVEDKKVNAVLFNEKANTLLSASQTGELIQWDYTHGTLIKKLKTSSSPIMNINQTIDGTIISTTSYKSFALIDPVKFKMIKKRKKAHTRFVKSGVFSSDNQRMITSSWSENTLALWGVPKLNEMIRFNEILWTDKAVFIQKDAYIASVNHGNSLKIWDSNKGTLVRELLVHTDWVMDLCESLDQKYLYTSGLDNQIVIWETATWTVFKKIDTQHTKGVTSLALSQNGKYLISTSLDKSVKIWDIQSGQLVTTIPTDFEILCVSIHNQQNLIAIAGQSNKIDIWDVSTICIFKP